jgi:hypothetical protein
MSLLNLQVATLCLTICQPPGNPGVDAFLTGNTLDRLWEGRAGFQYQWLLGLFETAMLDGFRKECGGLQWNECTLCIKVVGHVSTRMLARAYTQMQTRTCTHARMHAIREKGGIYTACFCVCVFACVQMCVCVWGGEMGACMRVNACARARAGV